MTRVGTQEVPTPELDKQHACNEPRPPFDVLTDFYDWLRAEGLVIAKYGRQRERSVTCPRCRGRQFANEGLNERQKQLLAIGALPDHERDPCPTCDATGKVWESYVDEDSLQPLDIYEDPEVLFARFWQLDLHKIRKEREDLLSALHESAPPQCKMSQEPTTTEDA